MGGTTHLCVCVCIWCLHPLLKSPSQCVIVYLCVVVQCCLSERLVVRT